jgi:hypothetical protein
LIGPSDPHRSDVRQGKKIIINKNVCNKYEMEGNKEGIQVIYQIESKKAHHRIFWLRLYVSRAHI